MATRSDDMILSGDYNIARPEVETALLLCPAVLKCAIVGKVDAEQGKIAEACVVLSPGWNDAAQMVVN